MSAETSIGQTESRPAAADEDDKAQTSIKGVDAHHANEMDMRRGLAGAEAKPFNEKSRPPGKKSRAKHTQT